ncbi:iduronate-2-sulfatase [Bacteroidia bacterium]|nr:iduronate-2-sulfatase [Bacteroidia bacterium]
MQALSMQGARQPAKQSDAPERQARMNVLFIAVDDLKPDVGAYGDPYAVTPNLDRIAREGFTFRNCYVQQAVSGPTRASLLTGMRPDKTKVWDLQTNFRQVNPAAVSLPQHLKANGYLTVARGKIFHMASIGPGHDAPSWSLPYVPVSAPTYALAPKGSRPATECADVPDTAYFDGRLAGEGIKVLQKAAASGQPFFAAIGFLKPHLPFVSPKKYWDLYDRSKFSLAQFRHKAEGSPDVAYHASGELKGYSDIPAFDSFSSDDKRYLDADRQRELIHGNYAAISYTDANIGKLLDELDRLHLADNTIVIVWGDHGWHLGDHGMWGKQTNFENATHACMLMRVPGLGKGVQPASLCEYVDVFPTLCELTATPTPAWLDGVSLVPAMKNPKASVRDYAFSQYPRPGGVMGYTIRTARYRYTEWLPGGYTAEKPYVKGKNVGCELYDYQQDPLETRNLVGNKTYAQAQKMMEELFVKAMEREHSQYEAYSARADWQKRISTGISEASKARRAEAARKVRESQQ